MKSPTFASLSHEIAASLREWALLFRYPLLSAATEAGKLLWLVKLRWLAIGLFFILAAPAYLSGLLDRQTLPLYMALLGLLMIFNLLSPSIPLPDREKGGNPLLVCFQLAFDLFALTALLFLSGGWDNPFTALFYLNAALAGILIPGRLSWPFLLLTHTFIGGLQLQAILRTHDALETRLIVSFIVAHLLTFSAWLIMRTLGAALEKENEQKTQIRVARERQDRLRAIGALAAGFSHEFSSPLNSLQLRLERAFRQNPSADLQEALVSLQACRKVVTQMNSSQMDPRAYQFKDLVVADLLSDFVEAWQEAHSETQVTLELESQARSSLPPLNFAQVIFNLLDNGYEANPQGQLLISLREMNQDLEISIEDEGPGLPEFVLRHRGEPFVTTKPQGTGLGLYVSELFAQSLGGFLILENRTPRGARVRLRWPKKEAQS